MAKQSGGASAARRCRRVEPTPFLASPRHRQLSRPLAPRRSALRRSTQKTQAQPGLGLHRTRGFPARGRKNPAAQPDANCWAKTARPAACAVSASANGGGAVGLDLASGGAGPAEGAAPPRSQQSFSGRRALGVAWDRGLLIWAFFT